MLEHLEYLGAKPGLLFWKHTSNGRYEYQYGDDVDEHAG